MKTLTVLVWTEGLNASKCLSNSFFEPWTSTGSGLFASLGSGLFETLGLIVFIREKKLSNTNLLALRHIKREKGSFPVDVHPSKRLLHKPLIASSDFSSEHSCRAFFETSASRLQSRKIK